MLRILNRLGECMKGSESSGKAADNAKSIEIRNLRYRADRKKNTFCYMKMYSNFFILTVENYSEKK